MNRVAPHPPPEQSARRALRNYGPTRRLEFRRYDRSKLHVAAHLALDRAILAHVAEEPGSRGENRPIGS
jgi:hypothetical protein